MSLSTHTYRAYLIGTPDRELSIISGTIRLDSTDLPHVTATLQVGLGVWTTTPVEVPDEFDYGYGEGPYGGGGYGGWMLVPSWDTDPGILTDLDPRVNARIRIDVDADTPAGAQARSFDLGLRARDIDYTEQTITLDLASDEALLTDYGPLYDDAAPFELAGSLRDVIDYVLDAVIPGAALEASPANDADVSAYWAATNLVLNPTAISTTGFGVGASATGLATTATSPWHGTTSIRWESTGAADAYLKVSVDGAASAGDIITVSAYLRASSAGLGGRLLIRWINDEGATIKNDLSPSTALPASPDWERLWHTSTAPRGADRFEFFILGEATSTGDVFAVDGLLATAGAGLEDWFYGGSSDVHYTYAWSDAPHASQSTREPVIDRDPDSLVWRSGQSAMDLLHPLVQAQGLRLVCNENREWTLRAEDYYAAGSTSIRHAVNMIESAERIDRDTGIWFDAAAAVYTWTVPSTGREKIRVDAYALSAPYTRMMRFEKVDTPYPGPGFAEYAVRRAQGRGREVVASCVSDWRAHAEQPVTIVYQDTPIQTGLTQTVEYDLSTDRMTVNTRTVDTPDAAWLLIPEDETWLDQPDGESWTEEVIA